MKKIAYILFSAVMAFTVTSCTSDKDVKFDELESYIATQNAVGVYRNGAAVAAFDKTTDQIYVNKNDKLFRMQSSDGTKYVELQFSAAPQVNEYVDAVMTTKGYDNLAPTVYSDLKVVELKDGLCRLAGSSSSSYTGFVVVWVE